MAAVYFLIALLFLAKAIEYFVKAHKILKGRRVRARLADYAGVRRGKRMLYSPVYEYEDGGEIKRYTSKRVFTYQEPLGSEKFLLISENGEVSD